MITFKQFIKEKVDKIPALDGGREIYITDTLLYSGERNALILKSTVKEIERLYDQTDMVDYWEYNNGAKLVHTGVNFDQARACILEHMQMGDKLNRPIIIDRILEQVDRLKAVVGTFKVMVIYKDDYEYIAFGVDVDLNAYNAAKHAAEDLSDF